MNCTSTAAQVFQVNRRVFRKFLQPSKDATEKLVVRTVAYYRSGMNTYALCDHSHRQTFSEADRLALKFLGAVTRIDEAIFSR